MTVPSQARPDDQCPSCGGDAGDNHFDRSLCACGSMHTCCNNCGYALDGCEYDARPQARPDSSPLTDTDLARLEQASADAHKITKGRYGPVPTLGDFDALLAEVRRGRERERLLELALDEALTAVSEGEPAT